MPCIHIIGHSYLENDCTLANNHEALDAALAKLGVGEGRETKVLARDKKSVHGESDVWQMYGMK